MKGIAEMTNTKDRVADATANVRPYIERALRDEELRRTVRSAYASARTLYDELLAKDDVAEVATKLASDEHLHDELRNVVDQLRKAAGRVQVVHDEDLESGAGRKARNGLLLFAGLTLGLLFNPLTGPPVRRWLKRKLFGGGDDGFVYHDGNGRGV
jgi:hypothetical protein